MNYLGVIAVIALFASAVMALPATTTTTNDETKQIESGAPGKIIGSRVVTSVSVVMNGKEPQFTDNVGKPVPRPLVPPQVASPIDLLNPDRYEFYTFNDKGELIKRLMTKQEIESIVAGGDGEGSMFVNNMSPSNIKDSEQNVNDILQNVQNVLSKEMESKKNNTNSSPPMLDTPDTSASWNLILPAIFGNTGGDITPPKPQQVVMTPDSVIMESSTLPPHSNVSPSGAPHRQSTPSRRTTSAPSTTPFPTRWPARRPTPSTTPEDEDDYDEDTVEWKNVPLTTRTPSTSTQAPPSTTSRKQVPSTKATRKPTTTITSTTAKAPATATTVRSTAAATTVTTTTTRPSPSTTKKVTQAIVPATKPSTTHPTTERVEEDTTPVLLTANIEKSTMDAQSSTAKTSTKVPSTTPSSANLSETTTKATTTEAALTSTTLSTITTKTTAKTTEKLTTITTPATATTTAAEEVTTKPKSTEATTTTTTTTTIVPKVTSTIMPKTTEATTATTILITEPSTKPTEIETTENLKLAATRETPTAEESTTIKLTGIDATTTKAISTSTTTEQSNTIEPTTWETKTRPILTVETTQAPKLTKTTNKVVTEASTVSDVMNIEDITTESSPIITKSTVSTTKPTSTATTTTTTAKSITTAETPSTTKISLSSTSESTTQPESTSSISLLQVTNTARPSFREPAPSSTPPPLASNINENTDSFSQIMQALLNPVVTDNSGLIIAESKPTTPSSAESGEIQTPNKIKPANSFAPELVYVEEEEPKITDLPTQSPSEAEAATTNSPVTDKLIATTMVTPEAENNKIVEQIDAMIAGMPTIVDKVDMVSVSLPQIPNDLTMTQYQEQSATVASILRGASPTTTQSILESDSKEENELQESFSDLISMIIDSRPTIVDEKHENSPPPHMEILNFKTTSTTTEKAAMKEGEDDEIKYETSVIKETSSISLGPRDKPSMIEIIPNVPTNTEVSVQVGIEEFVNKVMVPIVDELPMTKPLDVVDKTSTEKDEPETTVLPFAPTTTTPMKHEDNDDSILVQQFLQGATMDLEKEGVDDKNIENRFDLNLLTAPFTEFTTQQQKIATTKKPSVVTTEMEESVTELAEMITTEQDVFDKTEKVIEENQSTTEKSAVLEQNSSTMAPKIKSTTIATEMKSTTIAQEMTIAPTVKLTTTASEIKSTTTAIEIKSATIAPEMKSTTIAPENTSTTIAPEIKSTKNAPEMRTSTTIASQELSSTEGPYLMEPENDITTIDSTETDELEAVTETLPQPSSSAIPSAPVHRKEDMDAIEMVTTAEMSLSFNNRREPDETTFIKLGEPASANTDYPEFVTTTDEIRQQTPTTTRKPMFSNHLYTRKPVNKYDPALANSQKKAAPVNLSPAPKNSLGLEQSTMGLSEELQNLAKLSNELAFNFWETITSTGISSPLRSLVISPYAITSMLSLLFLGARGGTSGEMNEVLRLDEMITFNPHLVFRNITDSSTNPQNPGVAASVIIRELFSDRAKGKLLQFYKDKASQYYSAHVEEASYSMINDIIRRRTNILVKRATSSHISEFLRTNQIWLTPPLSAVSANIFQTDCSTAVNNERDREMFFQVAPAVRQRRLVPIPAAVWRTGFTAGYDPELDATAVAFGTSTDAVSTIFVMPGQQGHVSTGDNLERLESVLLKTGFTKNSWHQLLTTLLPREGLEVQIPKFSHRSYINATIGLQHMGLKELFNSDKADLRGLTGTTTRELHFSDMLQINEFATCGDEKLTENHHNEIYPMPPTRERSIPFSDEDEVDEEMLERYKRKLVEPQDYQRSFYDPLYDPSLLDVPLPLRPRQARLPETPRLRFDRPFMYFVRHNPTGMILHMGRFNPRLLP